MSFDMSEGCEPDYWLSNLNNNGRTSQTTEIDLEAFMKALGEVLPSCSIVICKKHRDMEAPDKGHPRQGSRPPKSSTAGLTRVTAPHSSGQ